MKLGFILILLLVFKVSIAQTLENPTNRNLSIKGEILDSKSGADFPAVLVTLFIDKKDSISVLSGLDGKFFLPLKSIEKFTENSYIEFLYYNYKPLIIKGKICQIKDFTIEMIYDEKCIFTKEKYLQLRKRRIVYFEE